MPRLQERRPTRGGRSSCANNCVTRRSSVAPDPPEVFSTTDWPALYENRNRSRSRSFSKIGSRSIDVGKSEIVTGLMAWEGEWHGCVELGLEVSRQSVDTSHVKYECSPRETLKRWLTAIAKLPVEHCTVAAVYGLSCTTACGQCQLETCDNPYNQVTLTEEEDEECYWQHVCIQQLFYETLRLQPFC